MSVRWSDLSYEGRALRRAFSKISKRIDNATDAMPNDELIKLANCAANLASRQTKVVDTTSLKQEVEELKSIVYNLPEETLQQVRAKLGK